MDENWLPVLDGHYEVSNLGRVRRRHKDGAPGNLRVLPLDRQGYQRIKVHLSGDQRNITVHALVALAFIGPRPTGYHVNHIDGVKTNNCAANLEYLSPHENQAHSTRMRLGVRGERQRSAKLTEAKVLEIRASKHEATRDKAQRFGVSRRTIGQIERRETWRHVE